MFPVWTNSNESDLCLHLHNIFLFPLYRSYTFILTLFLGIYMLYEFLLFCGVLLLAPVCVLETWIFLSQFYNCFFDWIVLLFSIFIQLIILAFYIDNHSSAKTEKKEVMCFYFLFHIYSSSFLFIYFFNAASLAANTDSTLRRRENVSKCPVLHF